MKSTSLGMLNKSQYFLMSTTGTPGGSPNLARKWVAYWPPNRSGYPARATSASFVASSGSSDSNGSSVSAKRVGYRQTDVWLGRPSIAPTGVDGAVDALRVERVHERAGTIVRIRLPAEMAAVLSQEFITPWIKPRDIHWASHSAGAFATDSNKAR